MINQLIISNKKSKCKYRPVQGIIFPVEPFFSLNSKRFFGIGTFIWLSHCWVFWKPSPNVASNLQSGFNSLRFFLNSGRFLQAFWTYLSSEFCFKWTLI